MQSYLDAICALTPAPSSAAWLRFVYTPLHGVARRLAMRARSRMVSYPEPDLVEAQFEPDPDFPTVHYPNPEEPGTLDLALALARRSAADLVIANDPDGDRLAVAVPDPDAATGWRVLTGDQVGALLGAFLLDRLAAEPETDMASQLVVATIVSGTLLSRIAAAAGAQYAQTLTELQNGSPGRATCAKARAFVFGYEEALRLRGRTETVRDKDGMSAALAILSLAAAARSAGESLLDAYNALEITHGVHLTAQLNLQSATTTEVMARLRAAAPRELAGQPVTSVTDYTGGSWQLPSADVLSFQLTGARVVIRPSGTEPKIKAYLEVVEPVSYGMLSDARREDRRRADASGLAGSDQRALLSPLEPALVRDAENHVRGLHDRDHLHALGQAELGGGLGRDGRDQAHAARVQRDVGGGLASGDARHLRGDLVTGAEPHGFCSHPQSGSCRHSAPAGAAEAAFAVRAPWWQARDHGRYAAT